MKEEYTLYFSTQGYPWHIDTDDRAKMAIQWRRVGRGSIDMLVQFIDTIEKRFPKEAKWEDILYLWAKTQKTRTLPYMIRNLSLN